LENAGLIPFYDTAPLQNHHDAVSESFRTLAETRCTGAASHGSLKNAVPQPQNRSAIMQNKFE
jgi:hypothetical protein